MAHIRAWGDHCPKARGIIHLGATSCYVDDNGDLIAYREALKQIRMLLVNALAALADFIEKNADTPVLAYTHYQAAQPTTVGKRAAMWAQDLCFDLERLDFELERIPFYGCKGATGTGASFLALFNGDAEKARRLELNIARDMGFESVLPICGQTYTRKLDYYFLSVLSGIAQSASKMATDLRLMAHEKEFDEPFTSSQVGSSAMAYKRNPMRSERICSLARYVLADAMNPAITASTQWLERTLDDSANRRISIPEAFLGRGRHTEPRYQHHLRLHGLSGHHGAASPRGAALPRHGEHPHARRGARRRPPGAARGHTRVLGRHRAPHEGDGLRERPRGKAPRDPRFKLDRETLSEILDIRKFVGMAPEQARSFAAGLRELLAANAAELSAEGKGEVKC